MITFKNLPDTTTPINAENLNNNFSGLDENQAVASIRVSTQESGNQWKKIAVMTFGGTDTYRIIGTSNVSGVNGRGHFELLISGENSNSASASLVSATNGINSSMFRVFASTNYKTITVYFESPQWTAYRVNAYLTRVYDSGTDSCTLYDTKETPTGNVEIPVNGILTRSYIQAIPTANMYVTSTRTSLTLKENQKNGNAFEIIDNKIKIKKTGKYKLSFTSNVYANNSATGLIYCYVYVNDSEVIDIQDNLNSNTDRCTMSSNIIFSASANNFIDFKMAVASGTALADNSYLRTVILIEEL